jgi:protease stability complex PrcB-like protein
VVGALALAIAGWLVYTQVWGTGGERTVAWTDLTPKLGTIEFTRRVTGVYHSRAAFVRLLNATMPGRVPTLPPHNWDRDQVVVIALGPRSSTGYVLRILWVVERRRGIYVYAREQTPSLGEPVTPRVTYPYRVIAMHGNAKPVYVKLQGRP